MIESLAEHGVDPVDLVPALMTTHTVKNPEYDPEAKRRADLAAVAKAEEEAEEAAAEGEEKGENEAAEGEKSKKEKASQEVDELDAASIHDPAPPYEESVKDDRAARREDSLKQDDSRKRAPRPPRPMPTLDDDEGDIGGALGGPEEEGDIGGALGGPEEEGDIGFAISSPPPPPAKSRSPIATTTLSSTPIPEDDDGDIGNIKVDEGVKKTSETKTGGQEKDAEEGEQLAEKEEQPAEATEPPIEGPDPDDFQAMPHLPGVSTSITAADEDVTLDIRWTVVSHCTSTT